MNVNLCDFFAQVATDSSLTERLNALPAQNRLAAAHALAEIAHVSGHHIPPEDFFPLLNVAPSARTEAEWDVLTSHVDMVGPIDPSDAQALMVRIHVIIERQRIKVFNGKVASASDKSAPGAF